MGAMWYLLVHIQEILGLETSLKIIQLKVLLFFFLNKTSKTLVLSSIPECLRQPILRKIEEQGHYHRPPR